MLRFLYVILLSFVAITAHSQDISGTWWGNFDREDLSANTRGIKLELSVKNDTVVTGSLTQVSHTNVFHQYSISGFRRGDVVYFHEVAGIATNGGGGYRKIRDYTLKLVSVNGKAALEGSSKNYSVGIMTMPKVAVWFEQEITDTQKKITEPPLAKNEKGETVIDARKLILKVPEPVKPATPVATEAPPVIASRPIPKKPVHQQITISANKIKSVKILPLAPDNSREAQTVIAAYSIPKRYIAQGITAAVVKSKPGTVNMPEADKPREEPKVEVTIPMAKKYSRQEITVTTSKMKPVAISMAEADKPREEPKVEIVIPKALKPAKQEVITASIQQAKPLTVQTPEAEQPRDAPQVVVTNPKPLKLTKQGITMVSAEKAKPLTMIMPEAEQPRDAPQVTVTTPKPLKLTKQGITMVSAEKAKPLTMIMPEAEQPRDAPQVTVTTPKPLKLTKQGITMVSAEKAKQLAMIMPVADQRRKETTLSVATSTPASIKTTSLPGTLNLTPVAAEMPVITVPPDTNKRPPKIIKTIEVIPGMPVKIEITDNARIDNDMISLYINDIKVLDKKRLTYEPVVYNITAVEKITDIAMYAESLGSMPPCTATMKVTADNVTHTVDMSSDFKINGTVRIILKK